LIDNFGRQTAGGFLNHAPARPAQTGTFGPVPGGLEGVLTVQIAHVRHLEQDLTLEIVAFSLWFEQQHGAPIARLE